MSDEAPATVADRVREVRKSLEPPEGRRSRLGHMSIEDFAAHIGTSKQRIIEWEAGTAYPDTVNRQRLADASGGRFQPDDFARSSQPDRLAALEAEVAQLREEREGVLREVFVRLGALEVALASATLQASQQPSQEKPGQ